MEEVKQEGEEKAKEKEITEPAKDDFKIIEIFKMLLGYNYKTYGTKRESL